MIRVVAAISAMVIVLAIGWLSVSPAPTGGRADVLRIVVSVLLLFGIATLAASFALIVAGHGGKQKQ